jgi:Cu(I)/Ag(I) efflux system membrane fusion protein
MKSAASFGVIALALLTAAGGYWAGQRGHTASADAAATATPAAAASAPKARKLRFYRNPMGLPDTSPTPKKDPMGMDYIAVYEGEDDEAATPAGGAPQIAISTEKIQKLGVRTEAAQTRALGQTVRAAGRVEADERRLFTVTAKYEGYIERLLVNTTGQPVTKGQPLFEVYSPELVAAQREYAIATQGALNLKDAPAQAQASMQQLADASLARLKNWDLSEDQLQRLRSSGQTLRTISFRAPVSGVVTEKKAQQGMRFMPGEMLYQVADLSSVWILADVFEQDLAQVKNGAMASVRVNAYPNREFKGRIAYVYPSLKAETRTVPVRIELANPGGLLKPGMFAQMELASGGSAKVLTVPDSAVIDTGKRSIVLVQVKPGRFEPRTLIAGRRSDSFVEVLQGVSEGEQVVVSANFLIDAESNLKAALLGLEAAPATSTKAAPSTGHKAEGKVDSVDAKAGTVTLSHGPVASLKWPAMTMEFKLANPTLIQELQPGKAVAIEFVERAPGEWVITAVTPH